jgi:2-iminobutanoate/2-iminopropanoate deaminase
MIERLRPEGAPEPRGPYSPAVRAGDFVFVSGQGPINPATDKLETGDIRHETRLILTNIQRILAAAGASMKDVVKCQVYLAVGEDFAAMNEVYGEFFGDAKPARTTVVTRFVANINVEIDAIAYKPGV